jgi:hypothetical protein
MRRYGSSESSQMRRPWVFEAFSRTSASASHVCFGKTRPVGFEGEFDDHDPRARCDRAGDRVDVEVERLRVEQGGNRSEVHGVQHRVVAEPSGDRDDHFVARVGQQREGERDGPERALGHRDVVRLERQAQLCLQPCGHRLLGSALTGLVRVPVDGGRLGLGADRR